MAIKNLTRSTYSVHPSIDYARAILENLAKKTGRSLEEWIELLQKAGPAEEKERRDWLKWKYGVGGTTAWMIAEHSVGKGKEGTDPEAYLRAAEGYVEEMYAGPKSALRPIHDALLHLGLGLGRDVKVCPCQTIVPFYRNNVFAQIKPSTRTRIDFGLALKGTNRSLPERLIDTGGLARKDRITHRFAIGSLAEVDDLVREWCEIAYELDS